jgi:hypothetical protein
VLAGKNGLVVYFATISVELQKNDELKRIWKEAVVA